MMVYRWVQVQKDEPTLTAQKTHSQSNRTLKHMAPRHLAWLLLRDAEQVNKQEKQTLSLTGLLKVRSKQQGKSLIGRGIKDAHLSG